MPEVVMPRLSDSMEEGTILRWLKGDGDAVARGDELVSIETDKAEMVYEADAAGTLRILAKEGATVAVGAPIATVGDGGAPMERRSASPLARRAATRLGVALDAVAGSGPRGRILKADVTRTAAQAPSAPPVAAALDDAASAPGAKGAVTRVPLSRLQQTVARRMAQAKATVPDFAVAVDVDMGEALALRQQLKQLEHEPPAATGADGVRPPVPSVTDLIVRAAALTLRAHPKVNGSYRDGAIELHGRVNVGIAVALHDGLAVPVVPDADRRTLREIAETSRRLVVRTREGSIAPPELSGGTFTVSNLGMLGVDSFAGVVNPPQAAILCVGATRMRPAVLPDGSLAARPLATLTLVSDHRVLYGADAAAFLTDLRARLERPLGLLS